MNYESRVPEPRIIYEDEYVIGVSKPAGLLVHGVRGHEEEQTLTDFLLKQYPEIVGVGDNPKERPGIIHRLDKDTSGVMVVARTQEAFDALKKIFQAHDMQKTYLALVHGNMKNEKGIITAPIGIKTGSVKRSVHSAKMAKEAITEYKVEKRFTRGKELFTLLKVTPQTGRTHQIRVHLASIGHGIVGDPLYGGKKDTKGISRQFLHAYSLELALPQELGGKRLMLSANLPEDLQGFLNSLTNAQSVG